jgi:hypothetical protein
MIKTSLVPLKMPWIFPTMLLNVSKNICWTLINVHTTIAKWRIKNFFH